MTVPLLSWVINVAKAVHVLVALLITLYSLQTPFVATLHKISSANLFDTFLAKEKFWFGHENPLSEDTIPNRKRKAAKC